MFKKEKITYPLGKFGILYDGVIVKIHAWSHPDQKAIYQKYKAEGDPDFEEEIYFNYLFWYAIIHRRSGAWAYESDFIGFGKTKRSAKRIRRRLKKDGYKFTKKR